MKKKYTPYLKSCGLENDVFFLMLGYAQISGVNTVQIPKFSATMIHTEPVLDNF